MLILGQRFQTLGTSCNKNADMPHTDDITPNDTGCQGFSYWDCRTYNNLGRIISTAYDQSKHLLQAARSLYAREPKSLKHNGLNTKSVRFYPPDTTYQRCSNIAEFIDTYIHPQGKHWDGSPLSDEEQQKDIEICEIYDFLHNDNIAPTHAGKPGRSTLRPKSWKGWLISILYALSGTPVMGNPSTRQHSLCHEVSEQHPDFRDISQSYNRALQQLSREIPLSQQQEIIRAYRSINVDIPHSSEVELIISGGTRPSSLLTRENHHAYAEARGMRYRHVYPVELVKELGAKQLYWMKVFALKNILNCESMPAGKWVVWLDDDIVIDDFSDSVNMLDKYINQYKNSSNLLVTEDNDYAKLNTGIIMVKKTENTQSFFHMWSLFSSDPKRGYASQEFTLHEQETLHEFTITPLIAEMLDELSLLLVVPSRDNDLNLNLNTFKRERYLNKQPWFRGNTLDNNGENERQTYQDGDSFIHHGTKEYRTRLILESLENALKKRYPENDPAWIYHWIDKWSDWFWS